jgi:hypothetical protein
MSNCYRNGYQLSLLSPDRELSGKLMVEVRERSLNDGTPYAALATLQFNISQPCLYYLPFPSFLGYDT